MSLTFSFCSGELLVCIVLDNEYEPLYSVTWNLKDSDTLAAAWDSNIYLLDVPKATSAFIASMFMQTDLPHFFQVFSITSVSHIVSKLVTVFISLVLFLASDSIRFRRAILCAQLRS